MFISSSGEQIHFIAVCTLCLSGELIRPWSCDVLLNAVLKTLPFTKKLMKNWKRANVSIPRNGTAVRLCRWYFCLKVKSILRSDIQYVLQRRIDWNQCRKGNRKSVGRTKKKKEKKVPQRPNPSTILTIEWYTNNFYLIVIILCGTEIFQYQQENTCNEKRK